MDNTVFILSLITCAELFLAGFIYHHNRESEINRVFAITILYIALWTFIFIELLQYGSTVYATAWGNLAVLTIVGISASFLHLSWVFPTRLRVVTALYKDLLWIGTTLILGASLYWGPPILILDTNSGLPFEISPFLFWGLISYLLILIGSCLYFLTRSLRHSHGITRSQISFILIGILTATLFSLSFDLAFPLILGNYDYLWLGPISNLFFIISILYAIVVHQLLDIRIFISRAIGYSLLLGVIIAVSVFLIFFVAQRFDSSQNLSKENLLPNLVAAMIIGFSFDPLRRWLQNITDKFLFRKEYDHQAVIKDLSQKLNKVIGLDEALEEVMQSLVHTLHVKYVTTFVFQADQQNALGIKRIRQTGATHHTENYFNHQKLGLDYFNSNPEILIVEDSKHQIEHNAHFQLKRKSKSRHSEESLLLRQQCLREKVVKNLAEMEVAVAIPLHLGGQMIGLILLGDKLSEDAFSSKDILLLELVGVQAVSSLQKAKLYEGDQMKSEFISIASHELLTPISAMEGYLSMILEETPSHVDAKAHDYINKVYTSVKRLSLLIKDLLSVSRIESGRMKIETQALDLNKLINDTIDQLKFVAQEKQLTLSYIPPKHPLPFILADPDRTMQILVNLISNAIKYTFEGGATITTSACTSHHPHAILEVSDTGMGISKENQAHLFEKFYRVDSPQTTGIIGTGLGLYITKSILEKMNGSISLKSTPDSGSTFTITFPFYQADQKALKKLETTSA